MNRRNWIESRARGGYGDWDQDRGGPEDREYYERGSGGYRRAADDGRVDWDRGDRASQRAHGGYDRGGNWDRERDRGSYAGRGSGYGGDYDRDRWSNSPRGGYGRSYGGAGGGDYERDRDYTRGRDDRAYYGRDHGYGSSSGYEPGYDRGGYDRGGYDRGGYDRDREGPYRHEVYGREGRYGDERDRARYGTGNIDVERGDGRGDERDYRRGRRGDDYR